MFEQLVNSLVQSYGPLGLFIVMIIQTIIAPISSELVLMFSSAIGMKFLDVLIIGSLGLIVGSVIAFYIARIGGKPIIIKLIGRKWIDILDDWVEENGAWAILLTRLVPIIPFDLISYVSGVTKLKFKHYFPATVVGAFPRTFILAALGISVRSILSFIGIGVEIVFYIGIIGFIVVVYLDRKGYLGFIKDNEIMRIIKKNFKKH